MNDVGNRPTGRREAAEETELKADLARSNAERNSLTAENDPAHLELRALLDQEIALLRDTLDAWMVLDRVQSTVAWRVLEAFRRQRLALRDLVMTCRGGRRQRRARRRYRRSSSNAPLGVNVAGYLNTESGMGEAARLSVRSLEAAGIPVALNNVSSRLRMDDDTYTAFTDANPHPFNLVHLNADNMEWFARARGRAYFRDRYTIGYWFWELAEFRRDWMSAFRCVDEVWVPTEFGRQAVAASRAGAGVCVCRSLLFRRLHRHVSNVRISGFLMMRSCSCLHSMSPARWSEKILLG